MLRELEIELRNQNAKVERQEVEIEMLKMKGAMYKVLFFHKYDLGEKLQKQLEENRDAITGEFDGLMYSSIRAKAKFRTLEDMVLEGIIKPSEYAECELL